LPSIHIQSDGGNLSKEKKYPCRYCDLEFSSKEERRFHEDNECDLNPNLLKDKNPFVFVWFAISSALKVAGLAVLVLSPAVLYIFLLGSLSPQYGYIAFALFWILLFGLLTILAGIVEYMRKGKP